MRCVVLDFFMHQRFPDCLTTSARLDSPGRPKAFPAPAGTERRSRPKELVLSGIVLAFAACAACCAPAGAAATACCVLGAFVALLVLLGKQRTHWCAGRPDTRWPVRCRWQRDPANNVGSAGIGIRELDSRMRPGLPRIPARIGHVSSQGNCVLKTRNDRKDANDVAVLQGHGSRGLVVRKFQSLTAIGDPSRSMVILLVSAKLLSYHLRNFNQIAERRIPFQLVKWSRYSRNPERQPVDRWVGCKEHLRAGGARLWTCHL